jgi:hypothetical protein
MYDRWRLHSSFKTAARHHSIVLSAGMPRSGSTWLFNAARLLLRERSDVSSGWVGEWTNLPRQPTMLVKVHDFDPVLAKHARVVLYSYRDIRDALASSKRMFRTEPTLEAARQWLQWDHHWRSRADCMFRYESAQADPLDAIERLAQALDIPVADPELIQRELMRVEFQPRRSGPGQYDRESLLHPGHITDGRHGSWKGWLSPALLQQIERECGDWLVANHYPLETSTSVAA